MEGLSDKRKAPFSVQLYCLTFPCGINVYAGPEDATRKPKGMQRVTALSFATQHRNADYLNPTWNR